MGKPSSSSPRPTSSDATASPGFGPWRSSPRATLPTLEACSGLPRDPSPKPRRRAQTGGKSPGVTSPAISESARISWNPSCFACSRTKSSLGAPYTQYVFTPPASSTHTWLCSHTISGNDSSAIRRERRPTPGISSSRTTNCRSIRYLGMLSPTGSGPDSRGDGPGARNAHHHTGLDHGRSGQCLQHYAVALGLLHQRVELRLARLRRGDVEAKPDGFEPDRCVAHQAEGAAQIEVTFHGHPDLLDREFHRGGNHLTGDLSAGSERSEQQVTGTGTGPGPADTGVCLGLIDGTTEINRARDGRIALAAPRDQRDPGGRRILAVPILEGFLSVAQIHLIPSLLFMSHASPNSAVLRTIS